MKISTTYTATNVVDVLFVELPDEVHGIKESQAIAARKVVTMLQKAAEDKYSGDQYALVGIQVVTVYIAACESKYIAMGTVIKM